MKENRNQYGKPSGKGGKIDWTYGFIEKQWMDNDSSQRKHNGISWNSLTKDSIYETVLEDIGNTSHAELQETSSGSKPVIVASSKW